MEFIGLFSCNPQKWQECLDLVSPIHPAPMIHLVHALPEVAKMVMDHSITSVKLYMMNIASTGIARSIIVTIL